MRTISVTHNKFALVDDDDYEKLIKFKWCAIKHTKSNSFYVVTSINKKAIPMHRMIIGEKEGFQIDHKDRNGLNNQKSNLRFTTRSQNQWNKLCSKNNPTGFKGVSRHGKKFKMDIKAGNTKITKCGFSTAIEAALCYDKHAIILHGEFACLNFRDKTPESINELIEKEEWSEASILFHMLKYTTESGKGIEMILEYKKKSIEMNKRWCQI